MQSIDRGLQHGLHWKIETRTVVHAISRRHRPLARDTLRLHSMAIRRRRSVSLGLFFCKRTWLALVSSLNLTKPVAMQYTYHVHIL